MNKDYSLLTGNIKLYYSRIMMRKLQFLLLCSSAYIFKWLKRMIFPLSVLFAGIILIACVYRFNLMCSNTTTHQLLKSVCFHHKDGKSIGNLCHELCDPKGTPTICHKEQDITFFGTTMNNTSAVFKFAKVSSEPVVLMEYDRHHNRIYPTEEHFSYTIQALVKSRFNLSLHSTDAQRVSYLKHRPEKINRNTEMDNVLSLLIDNEYLALTLYESYNLFPRILGSCGNLYAVQKFDSISGFWHLMTFYDSQEQWEKRIKISLMILDYLLALENDLPEPIVLCRIKMSNFGFTDDFKKVMYLDLESVYPVSVANSLAHNGLVCKQHSDCDFLDCRYYCNLVKNKCQYGVANNNLQIVCERIFLGWTMSGKMLIPGLLLGPRTPRYLVEMLEQCANPTGEPGTPRAPATMEIRNKLYNFLRHLL